MACGDGEGPGLAGMRGRGGGGEVNRVGMWSVCVPAPAINVLHVTI